MMSYIFLWYFVAGPVWKKPCDIVIMPFSMWWLLCQVLEKYLL